MPTDFSDAEAMQFESDLNRARGYKPVTQREMRQAYDQYKEQGLKFGQVKATDSDEALYAKAEKIVLDWWKYQQAQKIKVKQQRNQQRRQAQRDPLRGASSSWRGSGSGGGGRSGGTVSGGGTGGSGGGFLLPDTSMRPKAGGKKPKGDLDPIRRQLNPRQVRETLEEMGVPLDWVPPKWATRSAENMRQWVTAESERQDLILRVGEGRAYFDNGVVLQVAQQVGFSVNPNSVPAAHRVSVRKLRKYLLRQKRAWELWRAQRQREVGGQRMVREAAQIIKMRNMERL